MRRCVLLALLVMVFCSLSMAQIVPQPHYAFEKVSWRDSLESVKQILRGELAGGVKDTINGEGTRMYSYPDTVDAKPVRVSLNFADKGQHLTMVMLFYFGDSEGPSTPDSVRAKHVDELWNHFSFHYGSMYSEKKVLSFGATRTWQFRQTTVQLIKVHGPAEALTVIYRQ